MTKNNKGLMQTTLTKMNRELSLVALLMGLGTASRIHKNNQRQTEKETLLVVKQMKTVLVVEQVKMLLLAELLLKTSLVVVSQKCRNRHQMNL